MAKGKPEESKKPDDKPAEPELEVDEALSGLLDEIGDPLPQDGETEDGCVCTADEVEPVTIANVEPIDTPEDDEIANDIKEVIKRFKNVADDIVINFKEDREEIEDTINELRQLFTGTTNPKGFVVEGLVSALRTKADTNANAIKVLDTFAKLIAATKNMNIMQGTSFNVDLGELLKREPEDDED